MIKLINFVVLLLLTNNLFGQSKGSFSVRHYGMDDGLSYTRTKDIVQDKKGRIWIGTWNGIDKFDGYTFHNFKSYPTDKVKLNNNRIDGLTVNAVGNLWVQTYGSQIFLFNTEKDIFEDVFGERQHPLAERIVCLDNGVTWIITQNKELYRIDDRNYKQTTGLQTFGPQYHPYLGSTIYDIFLDSKGNEWILTEKGVLIEGKNKVNGNIPFNYAVEVDGTVYLASRNGYVASYANGRFSPLQLPIAPGSIYKLMKLDNDKFAIVTAQQIYIYATKQGRYTSFGAPDREEFVFSDKIYYDKKGRLWTFTSGGKLVCYDMKSGQRNVLEFPVFSAKGLVTSTVSFIHEDDFGEIWILPKEGIFCRYNKESNKLEAASQLDRTGNSRDYVVSGIDHLIDTHNNVWITTLNGFDYIGFQKLAYESITTKPNEEVRAVWQDANKRLWLGKANGAIEIHSEKGDYLGSLSRDGRIVRNKDEIFGARVYCFLEDKEGNIWLGTRETGLFVLEPLRGQTYRVKQYQPTDSPYSLASSSIFCMLQDRHKRIWIGCYGGGLNLVEKDSRSGLRFIHAGNRLKNYPVGQGDKVRSIYQSRKGTLLVGTNNGLITFSDNFRKSEEISFYYNFSTAQRSDCLSNDEILHIYQDRKQNIYISTFSGGIDITADSEELLSNKIRFRNINRTNGLASDLTLSVIEDREGALWIASANAFTRYNVSTGHFAHFTKDNLLFSPVITSASPFVDYSGALLFGSSNGALRILPNEIERSTFVPPIIFTKASVQRTDMQEERKLSANEILVLAKDERNVSISFAALDYANSAAIKYAYRLKGVDSSWVYINKNHAASFVGLPVGKHVLEVKSTNSDGIWVDNITSLPIYVTPTFWETGYAWVIYVLVFLLFVSGGILIAAHILHLRRQVDVEQKLTGMKLKFFTDISHELRTPLTLITNPIDEVLKREKLSEIGRTYMHTAQDNADRMLKLINQILDFRKIQNDKMKVYLEETDISVLIDKVYRSFSSLAIKNHIHYTIVDTTESQMVFTDTDKVEKILFNLLSNAFKYTPSDRSITLQTQLEKDELFIQVRDQGKGFDLKKSRQLFERFQTNDDSNPSISSGIGLALIEELVDLLHGSIHVQSEPHKGSIFTVRLPITYDAFAKDANVEYIWNESEAPVISGDIPIVNDFPEERKQTCILIVEDNEELRQFVRSILHVEYKILEAANGKEGLGIALRELPDIIVSDIMMPEMDGVALLDTIRGNKDVSHIPIILLTAKSSIDDQIEGFVHGADDYITKPFNSAYLKAKIASLVKRRELLHQYYLSHPDLFTSVSETKDWAPEMPKITPYDDEFILGVIKDIEQNIQNTDFRIEDLASAKNMSRPVFYRKVKSIVGLSPIDFVKKIRIKRAIQLLETGQFTVAEVAYQSGFTTSQYLSKVFKEIMGCSPSQYLKNRTDTDDGAGLKS